ncbi:TonB-dependent receptor [Sphingomonas psychrotolerans]|uniref:TonB-dependent receptor n=1 Tax=Sphingomonas psychrotolerans TaxID=1327635 RepID=A0A2K8MK12_9SPHN|nr:TonB-dependent receptor [Sphingomonas psychrotolerans]ATY34203.1 TonB-dependent receptor [Sphingomonas psychrotolerans]
MAALALNGGPGGPHRRRSPVPWGRVAAAGGIALAVFVAWTMFSAQIVTKRPNEMKTTQVILPPPPPPPPEVKPEEKPPEPTEAPPIDQPTDTPPPPDQAKEPSASPSSDPAPGDNALSAREGAGPSNYGLAVGNGGGTRIGGRAGGGGGGNGFAAYAQSALAEIRRATQADRELARGRYSLRLLVTVAEDGRITGVRLLDGSGSERRDTRLVALLNRLQLQRPPAGMPAMRIEFNTRSGA